MEHGIARLKTLPLSLRLVQELHEKLMRDVRDITRRRASFAARMRRGSYQEPGLWKTPWASVNEVGNCEAANTLGRI